MRFINETYIEPATLSWNWSGLPYQTTRRYNPEDSHLRTNRRENLKPYSAIIIPLHFKVGRGQQTFAASVRIGVTWSKYERSTGYTKNVASRHEPRWRVGTNQELMVLISAGWYDSRQN
jgi:hypothetical protein